MIRQFEKLTKEESELVFKAPVLVSVLASSSLNKINRSQKNDAIKLAHVKTFTATPLLLPYYKEVDKNFKEEFEVTQRKYFPFDEAKQAALKKEIDRVNKILLKLDKEFGSALHKSLEEYGMHVKRSAHTVFQDFVFPLALPKFSG